MKLRNVSGFEGGVVIKQSPGAQQKQPLHARIFAAFFSLLTIAVVLTTAVYIYLALTSYNPIGILHHDEAGLSFPMQCTVETFEAAEGSEIKDGQIIAKARTNEIDAMLAVAEAELAKAKADLSEKEELIRIQQLELNNKHEDKLLSLQVREDELNSDMVKDQARLARLKSEVEGYKKEFERAKALAEKGVSSGREFDRARTDYESRANELAELEVAVKQSRQMYTNAKQRRIEWEKRLVKPVTDQLLDAATKKVLVVESELAKLKLEKESLSLKSTINGTVLRYMVNPGEVVSAGQPVMEIASGSGGCIESFIEEKYTDRYIVGTSVIITSSKDGAKLKSVVEWVSPIVNEIPRKFQRFYTGSSVFGKMIRIKLPENCELPTGATFSIDIE
ncbi:MAG: HlyD family efflux transporter periplasmic adaptor subunit [Planctomycetes bacterium]|nr:HlyD family efflux transporter periplasmic adaptor subunit [Planctomycetota bacterium]